MIFPSVLLFPFFFNIGQIDNIESNRDISVINQYLLTFNLFNRFYTASLIHQLTQCLPFYLPHSWYDHYSPFTTDSGGRNDQADHTWAATSSKGHQDKNGCYKVQYAKFLILYWYYQLFLRREDMGIFPLEKNKQKYIPCFNLPPLSIMPQTVCF